MDADELETLRKQQNEEFAELTGKIAFSVKALHAHMEGFIETVLKSKPNADALLDAVKVAMIAGADAFHEFGGRQKVTKHLQTVVFGEIEDILTNDENLNETKIKEIERILLGIREAIEQLISVK